MKGIVGFLLLVGLGFSTAQAAVTQAGESSFTVSHTVTTGASGEQAWKTMINHVNEWWHPDHSWSGDANNFYIKAELGGCFCEHLPADDKGEKGGVEHLRIIYFDPNAEVRFDGSLGPLVDMAVQGRMSWKISPAEAGQPGASITFTYRVHGYMEGGFEGLAPVVDGVIGQQIQRLQALLDR
jgi:hypothetical protein